MTSDYTYRATRCAGDGYVLVGDAFGFMDPIYSSGVLLAFKSGELAADADVGLLGDTLQALGERAVARYLEASTSSRRAVAESLAAQTSLLVTPYLEPAP